METTPVLNFSSQLKHQTAFQARTDLTKYRNNALLLFALQLRYQIEDIDIVATNALTDDNDDKKADLVFVNSDEGYVVIAQAYLSDKQSASAPSNKAADLNTAISWLLARSLDDLPDNTKKSKPTGDNDKPVPANLRSAATELRNALKGKQIRNVNIWYVHNLPESSNCANELKTVEQTAKSVLADRYPESDVREISCKEIGQRTLEEWYESLVNPILVSNEYQIKIPGGYSLSSRDWSSFVTAVPGKWLYKVFREHQTTLFSANIRGYLGSTRSDANINNGIKKTAENESDHFWVYNNGLTALVHDFTPGPGADMLTINGISIVNGAQTTGAIGSLDSPPDENLWVPARFVKCTNREVVTEIIRFNNSQNKVAAADFRSNDPIQRRLRDEFLTMPDVTYTGGRRGGHDDIIRRTSNALASDAAAQALAAFHSDPIVAYNQKSEIWESDTLYSRYFSEKTHAAHIVFCYGLLKSIEAKKVALMEKDRDKRELTSSEKTQLSYLRLRGANFLLMAAIAKCCEIFTDKAIPDTFALSFGNKKSPQDSKLIWNPIVESSIAFCAKLVPAIERGLKNQELVSKSIDEFRSLVDATRTVNSALFDTFSSHVQLA